MTRYPSISTRKLSNALKMLTSNKCMVATSDYDEFHKMAKRCLLTNVLGGNAQVNLLIQLSRAFTVSLYMLCIRVYPTAETNDAYFLYVLFRSDIESIETQ